MPGLDAGEGGVTSGQAELWAVPGDAGDVSKSGGSICYGSASCWDHVLLDIPAPCPLGNRPQVLSGQGAGLNKRLHLLTSLPGS